MYENYLELEVYVNGKLCGGSGGKNANDIAVGEACLRELVHEQMENAIPYIEEPLRVDYVDSKTKEIVNTDYYTPIRRNTRRRR